MERRQSIRIVLLLFHKARIFTLYYVLNTIKGNFKTIRSVRLQLHGAIYRPDSFVLTLHRCVNLKAIRYESTNLNRIAADKSHHVIVALEHLKQDNSLTIICQYSVCVIYN